MFAANEEIKLKNLGNKVSVFRVSLQKKNIIGTWESFSSNGCSIMA